MLNEDKFSHFGAMMLSLMVHACLLFFVVPIIPLKIESSNQYFIPVRLDLGQIERPVTAEEPGHSGTTKPAQQGAIEGGEKKVLPKGELPAKPMPQSNEAEGVAKPAGMPGDRANATTANVVVPIYPKVALNNNWTGTVVVRIHLDSQGRPGLVDLVKSSGYLVLDEAFIRTIKNYYTFKPKRVMGVDVADVINMSYTYSLDH